VIVGSDIARENLIVIQRTAKPIRKIPPLDRVNADVPVTRPRGCSNGVLNVLHIGRLAERKGIEELLSAWQLVDPVDAELHLYGPTTPWAEQRIDKWRKLPGVHFHGPLGRDALARIVAEGSFGVVPSMCEGFGLVSYEFMSLGLPFVMTDTGAAREFGSGNSDCIICERSIPALGEAIVRMAERVRAGQVSGSRLRDLWRSRYAYDEIAAEHVRALTSREYWRAAGG
jgi:glycosyltransferase involved in cell wall biosynthesis